MKWLRKAKNSAILVDVVLVVLLFAAAIGFASFVHLRNANKPQVASAQETLSLQSQPESVLGESTDSSAQADNPDNSTPANNPDEAHADVPAETASGTPIAVVLPAIPPLCDTTKKLQLKNTYDSSVRKEGVRYDDAIKSLRILNPTLGGGDTQRILEPEHKTILNNLYNNYLQQLAAINCTP